MDRTEIMNAIEQFARSTGFYGRLLRRIRSLSEEEFDALMTELESQEFEDVVDLILYLEE